MPLLTAGRACRPALASSPQCLHPCCHAGWGSPHAQSRCPAPRPARLPRCPQSLAANIAEAYYRLEPFLHAAVRAFVRQHLDTFAENEDGSDKQFWISFYGLLETDRLRSLRSAKIGKLSQFVGTVTRTTDVRPELYTGTFRCMECMTGGLAAGGGGKGVGLGRGCCSQVALQIGAASTAPRPALMGWGFATCRLVCSGPGRGAAVQVHAARHLPQRHLRQHVSEACVWPSLGSSLCVLPLPSSCPTALPPPPHPSPLPCSTAWSLVMDQSHFVDWQKAKVQENPDEVRWRQLAALRGLLVWLGPRSHARAAAVSGRCGDGVRQVGQRPARTAGPALRPDQHEAPSHLPRPPVLPARASRLAQVPAGSLPRTMEVILRNDQVESVRPGDKAVFTGMLVVVPDVAALT